MRNALPAKVLLSFALALALPRERAALIAALAELALPGITTSPRWPELKPCGAGRLLAGGQGLSNTRRRAGWTGGLRSAGGRHNDGGRAGCDPQFEADFFRGDEAVLVPVPLLELLHQLLPSAPLKQVNLPVRVG